MRVRDGKIIHRTSMPCGRGGKDAVVGIVYQTPWGHWFEMIKVFKSKEGQLMKGYVFSAAERQQVTAVLEDLCEFVAEARRKKNENSHR
jgi:hypothetical protein